MSRYYTEEFKRQIVELRKSGKTVGELVEEYRLAKSTISVWEKQYKNSGKFSVKDNLSDGEKELRVLRKENRQQCITHFRVIVGYKTPCGFPFEAPEPGAFQKESAARSRLFEAFVRVLHHCQ